MKKSISIIIGSAFLVTLFICNPAMAVNKTNVGCGLGTLLWQDHDSVASQVLAVTTNGTFGNQTFGITSGTLECDKPQALVKNEKLNIFVSENMDNLAKNLAQGSGEYLDTLAVLMEIPIDDRQHFRGKLQQNFSIIYTSNEINHIDVINNIEDIFSNI